MWILVLANLDLVKSPKGNSSTRAGLDT